MEDERDIVVFSDDEGNEFELDVIDYFDYEDQEYAVLMDLNGLDEQECDCDSDECACKEYDVFIMKVVVKDDMEEFLPADEDKMDALSAIVEERLKEMDEDGDEENE